MKIAPPSLSYTHRRFWSSSCARVLVSSAWLVIKRLYTPHTSRWNERMQIFALKGAGGPCARDFPRPSARARIYALYTVLYSIYMESLGSRLGAWGLKIEFNYRVKRSERWFWWEFRIRMFLPTAPALGYTLASLRDCHPVQLVN